MIPAEAVELAAGWLWARDSADVQEVERPTWADARHERNWAPFVKGTRQDARELLEAAAPHMLAEACDEGRESFALTLLRPLRDNGTREPIPNPYRPTP